MLIVSFRSTRSLRFWWIVIVSSRFTVSVRLPLTKVVSCRSIVLVRSRPTQCVSSFSTSMSWFFSAWIHSCSSPFLSSKRIALAWLYAPPLLERVSTPLWVALAGSSQGGMLAAL